MRHLCLFALLFAAFTPTAKSQVIAVYGTFSPVHLSNVQTGAVYTSSGYQNQTTSFWAAGVGGGITLNFLQLGPVKLGVNLRGSTRPGTPGADTGLVGLKLAIKPPLLRVKPYVQVSGGYVASRTANVSTTSGSSNPNATIGGTFGNQYAAYEILGGVDSPLLPILDLRLIEVGVGRGSPILGSSAYNTTPFTLNTGVVLHF